MTDKEAIEIIKVARAEVEWEYPMEYAAAFDRAIEALEQGSCEDCVSRKAVLDKIEEVCYSTEQEWVDFRVSQGSNGQRDLIINFIENFLPSVQPKSKTGHWIVKDYCTKMGEHYKGYECPACHKEYNLKTNFCPDCGNRNGE